MTAGLVCLICFVFTRCPYEDDRFRTTLVPVGLTSGLQYPTQYRRFVVKMFTFVDKDLIIPQKEQVCHVCRFCFFWERRLGLWCYGVLLFSNSSSTVVRLCASSPLQSTVNLAVIGQVSLSWTKGKAHTTTTPPPFFLYLPTWFDRKIHSCCTGFWKEVLSL